MPNEYRIRQINRLENVGSPAVRTFPPTPALRQRGPACALGSGGSQRGGIATCFSIGRDEYRHHGNSAVRAGVDGAGAAILN